MLAADSPEELPLRAALSLPGAFLAQTAAQRRTPPTALIFTTQPVFAAITGRIVLSKTLGGWGLVGCGLILAGMLAAELPLSLRRRSRPRGGQVAATSR